ncbi:MAG: hypothetical protein RI884_939 [Pseudomonadota bacterium]
MSSLTVGLAILGGTTLAALVAWNAWTNRRHTPRQPEQAPPVEDSESPEPVLRDDTEPEVADGPLPPVEAVEPVLQDAPLGPVPAPERKPPLDALIDSIASIALDGSPISGDAALAALPPTRRVGSKPFAVEGLNDATGLWEMPQAGQRYGAFQAGVQLANRSGALNEIEFSEFVVKAQAFADAVGGTADFPDMRDEVARARELDQFASARDAQLSLTLRARLVAWSPGYLHQHASRLGFVAGALPGRLVLSASTPGALPIMSLSFDTQAALADDPTQAALLEFTLTIDVPQVPREERPFERLREASTVLSQSMDGIISDDRGQPIRDEVLDAIGAELTARYDSLDARELSAGSPLARRLFS